MTDVCVMFHYARRYHVQKELQELRQKCNEKELEMKKNEKIRKLERDHGQKLTPEQRQAIIEDANRELNSINAIGGKKDV